MNKVRETLVLRKMKTWSLVHAILKCNFLMSKTRTRWTGNQRGLPRTCIVYASSLNISPALPNVAPMLYNALDTIQWCFFLIYFSSIFLQWLGVVLNGIFSPTCNYKCNLMPKILHIFIELTSGIVRGSFIPENDFTKFNDIINSHCVDC